MANEIKWNYVIREILEIILLDHLAFKVYNIERLIIIFSIRRSKIIYFKSLTKSRMLLRVQRKEYLPGSHEIPWALEPLGQSSKVWLRKTMVSNGVEWCCQVEIVHKIRRRWFRRNVCIVEECRALEVMLNNTRTSFY